MSVCALDHQLTHSQRHHVCLGHSQFGDIQLACCALRDDSRIGGQVLDVRPIDVSSSNIRLHHAGHGCRKGRNSRPVNVGFVDIGGRDLRFGNLCDVCCQPFNLRPINVGVDDIRGGDLGRGDHGNGGVQLVRRNRSSRQFLDLSGNGIQGIDVQNVDQGFGNVRPRDTGVLNMSAADSGVFDL